MSVRKRETPTRNARNPRKSIALTILMAFFVLYTVVPLF